MHLCSLISLPSPSAASLVRNPQSHISSSHVPRRTSYCTWWRSDPKEGGTRVECKHGDGSCPGRGALGKVFSLVSLKFCLFLLSHPNTYKVSMALRNREYSYRDDLLKTRGIETGCSVPKRKPRRGPAQTARSTAVASVPLCPCLPGITFPGKP